MGEPTAVKHLPALPVELWLKVFRWATLDPWTHVLYATDYHRFDSVVPSTASDKTNKTKQALPLVCKDWRRWATPLLYEDIIINDSYSSELAHALEHGRDWGDGSSTPPCGPLVRCARLPYSSTTTSDPNSPLPALAVLRLCPALNVLMRPFAIQLSDQFQFQFPVSPDACPPLPALRRLDWWYHNEATRSGGINALMHVLALAPALTYLSVGGTLVASHAAAVPVPVCLPQLATLRLRQASAMSVVQLARCALPALRHAVLDHVAYALGTLSVLWHAFGAQMRVVELGVNLGFLMEDVLTNVLAGCPRLEELYYCVQFTLPPLWQAEADGDGDGSAGAGHAVMESLRTVGLHARPNAMFTVGSAEYWSHLGRHFEALCRPTFPALRRVVLYGEWSAVFGDDQFIRVAQPLRTKGCSVEMDIGVP